MKHLYEFGGFQLDALERVLRREGRPVQLTPKALDTLLVLVERSGHIVAKDELMQRLWPDSFVEEGNLAFNISILRKALAEGGGDTQFIETVPKRGYRFTASVRELGGDEAAVVLEQQTTAHIVIEEVSDEGPPQSVIEATSPSPAVARFARLRQPRWLVALAAVGVGVVALVTFWLMRPPAPKSLAVLPFKPLAAGASDQYLELGMADALITKLSNVKQVIVRPTSSIMRYAAGTQDALAAGRELGVDSVLDGSVQRIDDRVRVTVRLLRVSDGAAMWAEKFDEHFTNIFALQDSISQRLASALTLRLTGEEQRRLTRRYTESQEAYQAYLKGRYYWAKWNGGALQKSLDYFEQALAADPQYALAHCGVADVYNLFGYLGLMPPRDAFPKSEAAARRALAIDDALSEAHLSLAKVKLFYDWDGPGFEREIERALDLDPNDADAHSMRGTYLLALGRFDEALAERKRGQELDPLSPLLTIGVAWVHYYARRYDQAIEWDKKTIELDTNFVPAHNDLAMAYLLKGMDAEALNELLTARTISGAKPETIAALRQAYGAAGIKGYWQKELELANNEAQHAPVGSMRMARIYALLGDRDRAIEWLNKAYDERNSLLIFAGVLPLYDGLRDDPRFRDLVRRVGLS
ncbi:MAG TPA: winged helix-turn-helix domain-containing protein [Blastocatellia bacterium]|nr:winged helix-turn-helix domain-containing protein [Blastocatellia bacterium]